MKLNNNTKRVLLFAALLLAAYLISLAFGGKDEAVPQGTGGAAELETGVLQPEEEDRSSADASMPETDDEIQEESKAESSSDAEEEPEALTLEEVTEEPEEQTPEEASEEADTEPAKTETQTQETTEAQSSSEQEISEAGPSETETKETETEKPGLTVKEDGEYTDKEHVALYIHTYGHLPDNYITKKEANELGWPEEGNLGTVAPGKSIGGDYFGNYEGLLPKKKGRKYYECDIDFKGKSRGAKRIIFSNDGLIFYTNDHYESFEQLYGGD